MSRLEEQWKKFHEENPQVWDLFKKYTMEVVNTGRKHYSVNAIIERIRWHTNIETKGEQFKISNNHRAYYARYFHEQYPSLDGFFKTKRLRASNEG